jgi:uncharacterized integral membrane protein (TIGR00698 family)
MSTENKRSALLHSEDWVSVWLGFGLIAMVLLGFRPDMPSFGWDAGSVGKAFSTFNLQDSFVLGAVFIMASVCGIALMGGRLVAYMTGFPLIFMLAWASQWLGGNAGIKAWGISYVIFALLIGLLISNTVGVPEWLKPAIRTEYYIKAGLVLLGSNIIFQEILRAGFLGILQALLVIVVVWYACFWLARKLRVDDEFAVIIATAVSVCGVSAAIAACGAIQGDRKKLSYTTSLVLIVAAPMMLIMPWIVTTAGIPEVVGGAWIGGTIDTTAAVVAAGELLGDSAANAAVIVKLSQNAMLGITAFLLSLWWSYRDKPEGVERPSVSVIWERFPKFVLGFMLASVLFSFVIAPDVVAETGSLMKGLRTWWFALAFVCIGLETRFAELFGMDDGRPALAFIGAQAINVVWTLLIAYLVFGGIVFPAPQL